ncbi:DUF2098 domain-containing protein [Methanobacterium sp.]|uniref:DUF2098 domain-containing protein n=1 Tax=Methanobacterium sp. TaxID=2164 RepID=UPI003C73A2C0
MEVEDVRGKPIQKGIHVRYTGTGSAGEAVDFKTDDQGTWVLLDTTDLWYKTNSLEVIGETEYNKMKNHIIFKSEKTQEDADSKESVKNKIDKAKSKFEDVDMSNELCDGGG